MNISQEPGPSDYSRDEFATSDCQDHTFINENEFYFEPENEDRGSNSEPQLANLRAQEDEYDTFEEDIFNLSHFKPAGTKKSRDYYPLKHHQLMFDAWEAAYPDNPIPGAGGTLADLQDGDPNHKGGRPPHGMRFIIECAIYGSPEQRLTLREIQIAMVRRFAWFSDLNNRGWQNSVRHALSRLTDFKRLERPQKDGDPGAWWIRTSKDPPNIKPFVRSDKRAHRPPPVAGKSGRKPKPQVWSDMTAILPSSSPSSSNQASQNNDPYSTAQRSEDAPRVGSLGNHYNFLQLAPFVYPATPDYSLPTLSSTGLLG
ncbi:hypothetical protein Clacol_005677 [Clathrus columnatus]|uniref:Fork-head domain-containing protein n=1 Tax=Clathrus columnatus TaxID=1419009 RepID=A0AAV5AA10_9AGAM|nr:hypothetical protein Clacol_005677 [Clathrus columnatus]